ncbi:zinc finger (CCCH type) motif-containing protein [Besnoitia besnoiti]|uniref:Zinc finger (CCCH type) motif-containing protein n=1 Tax=Besnoitia besnoiti TaxID=94643 RepID=A0A2A9MNN7_BESBE|nr:zinc finger (CCCH type) motif-containing protein [Besnoitia besnoiti]PFH37563.1 zinc finger (CCCH type) motif-containing protein [Besnoitia besnoiti]
MASPMSGMKPDGFCPPTSGTKLQNEKKNKLTFNNFYKTKLCPWYIKGSCHWGARCNYAHTLSEQREAVDLTKTKLCPTWLRNCVCRNPKCRYAHDYTELRATTDVFKTSLCSFFIKGMSCPMETSCRFAHGVHELRLRSKENGQPAGISRKDAQARAALATASAAAAAAHAAATAKAAAEAKAAAAAAIAGLAEASHSGASEPIVSPPVAQVLVPLPEGGHVPLSCSIRGDGSSAPKNAEGRARRQPTTGILALDKDSGTWRPEMSASATDFVFKNAGTPTYPLAPKLSTAPASSLQGNGVEGVIERILQSLQCQSGSLSSNAPTSGVRPHSQVGRPREAGMGSSFDPRAAAFNPGGWLRQMGNGSHGQVVRHPRPLGIPPSSDSSLNMLDFSSLLSTVAMAMAGSPSNTTKPDVPMDAFLQSITGDVLCAPGLSAPWNRAASTATCSSHLQQSPLRSTDASMSSDWQTTASGGEESSFPLLSKPLGEQECPGAALLHNGAEFDVPNKDGVTLQGEAGTESNSLAGERLDAAGTLLLAPGEGGQEETSAGSPAARSTKLEAAKTTTESSLPSITGSRQTTAAGVDCE